MPGFGHSHSVEQRHGNTHGHRQRLAKLLGFRQYLKAPEFPLATRGLEGMRIANTVLKDSKARGILIGGLSEEIWNQRCTEEKLAHHKDVDVMVIDPVEIDKFEGGIDWWLSSTETLIWQDHSHYPVQEKPVTSFYNGNGAMLNFGATLGSYYDVVFRGRRELEPGLYIPDHEWVVDMRVAELLAMVDHEEVDYKALRTKIRKGIQTAVPKFILSEFKESILSRKYRTPPDSSNREHALHIKEFSSRLLSALRGETSEKGGTVQPTPQ